MRAFATVGLLGLASFAPFTDVAAAQLTPPPAEQAPPPAGAPGSVSSPGNAKWATTSDEARSRAASEAKFVFLEFDRPECGACGRMDALLYPAFDFEALLIPMVPAKVPLDSGEGRELARRYGFREAPAILVTTPEGRLIFLMEGFANAPDFYQRIQQDLQTYRAFARRIEGQNVAALAPREALDTGRELYQRSDPATALARLERAVSAPKSPPAVRDQAREILAAVELDLGQVAQSRRTTARLIATTRDPRRKERAELFRAQIPLAENNPTEALALFRKFEKDHPKSPYTAQVRAMLDRLADPNAKR